MKQELKKDSPLSIFEQIRRIDSEKQEYWSARDLAKVLEYADYRNFAAVIEKGKEACENSGQKPQNHFVTFTDMIEIGKGAKREISDVKLSRYACYLIVQNADPSKEVVALGQTYFAIQTRIAELKQTEEYNKLSDEEAKRLYLRRELSHHNVRLAGAAKEAGVIDSIDYAIFQGHGYKGLYGGLGAKDIHVRKGLKKSQKILDHMVLRNLQPTFFVLHRQKINYAERMCKGNRLRILFITRLV